MVYLLFLISRYQVCRRAAELLCFFFLKSCGAVLFSRLRICLLCFLALFVVTHTHTHTHTQYTSLTQYNTTPRNRNRIDRSHLEICLSSSQKKKQELTCLGSADLVSVSYLDIESYRVSAESRAGEWEFWAIDHEKSLESQEDHSILSNSSQPAGNRIWASRAWTQFLCRKWELACLPPWVAKEKIGFLLLASEMPVPIPRSRTVCPWYVPYMSLTCHKYEGQ